MSSNELRQRWRQHRKTVRQIRQQHDQYVEDRGGELALLSAGEPKVPEYPTLPDEVWDLRCGARTRAGTPCKRRDLYDNGRCRLHGGPSTGPRTKRGRRKSAKNGFKATRTP